MIRMKLNGLTFIESLQFDLPNRKLTVYLTGTKYPDLVRFTIVERYFLRMRDSTQEKRNY